MPLLQAPRRESGTSGLFSILAQEYLPLDRDVATKTFDVSFEVSYSVMVCILFVDL
jgi:hypothetical protein